MTKHADELYAKYYAAATEAAKVDKELRLRRALWSNHSILKARSLDHNKETGNKKKSIGRSINGLKKVLEEHVLILNSRIALGLAVGPLAAATDWTSASFEPPASQATGTSQCSTSEMEEEFVAVYDRLARCNEQAVLNIHHIRSLDLMIRVLVDRHGKNVRKHLDASETHGELAKAFHATRELALMQRLREQFDKAKFKIPPLPMPRISPMQVSKTSSPTMETLTSTLKLPTLTPLTRKTRTMLPPSLRALATVTRIVMRTIRTTSER